MTLPALDSMLRNGMEATLLPLAGQAATVSVRGAPVEAAGNITFPSAVTVSIASPNAYREKVTSYMVASRGAPYQIGDVMWTVNAPTSDYQTLLAMSIGDTVTDSEGRIFELISQPTRILNDTMWSMHTREKAVS